MPYMLQFHDANYFDFGIILPIGSINDSMYVVCTSVWLDV